MNQDFNDYNEQQNQSSNMYQQPVNPNDFTTNTYVASEPQQPNNNQPKKKNNNLVLIIIIIIGLLLMCVGIYFVLSPKDKDMSNNNNQNNSNSGSNNSNNAGNNEIISQILVDYDRVVALTETGKLYVVQDQTYDDYYGEGTPSVIETPMIIAENVKEFFGDGSAYVDFNNNLYRAGLNPVKGGFYDQYTKLGTNIKTVYNDSLGLMAVSNDGELYVFGNSQIFLGADDSDSSLTKVSTESNDIIDVGGIYSSWKYYLTSDGSLYINSFRSTELKKEVDNVSKVEDEYVYTEDGKIYVVDYYSSEFTLKETNINYEDGYPTDVKTLLFDRYNFLSEQATKSSDGYVYINNSNKIVLYDVTTKTLGYENGMPIEDTKVDKKELNNVIDSLDDIIKFVQNYQY